MNLDSAEAIKNFCLCACGKLSLEEINREKESPENSEDEEQTYRPDQPRAPKGQSDGGQWVSEGGGSGESSETGGTESKKQIPMPAEVQMKISRKALGLPQKLKAIPPTGQLARVSDLARLMKIETQPESL